MIDLFKLHLAPVALFENRRLLWELSVRELSARYRGAWLGWLWIILTPLLLFGLYGFVFGYVVNVRWPGLVASPESYLLAMLCGLSLYTIFSDGVNAATLSIRNNPNFVQKIVFPIEVLPAAKIGAAFVSGAVWVVLLLLFTAYIRGGLPTTAGWLPLVILPLFFLVLGFGWFTASLAVYLRDTSQVVEVTLRLLLYATPIFYSMELVPSEVRTYLTISPLTHFVENTRQLLLYETVPSPGDWALLWGIALAIFHLGFVWMKKTREGFADVL